MEKSYKFSLRLKLVIFTTILAIITYTFSALFIYVLYDYVQAYWSITIEWYTIIILLLGVIWSGILAFFAARVITKPMESLEKVASEAAKGNLNQEVHIPKSHDEIRDLSIAVDTMLNNLNAMVHNIDKHFESTNETVIQMKEASHSAAQHSAAIGTSVYEISKGAENSSEAIQNTAEAVEVATELAKKCRKKQNNRKLNQVQCLRHSMKVKLS